MRTQFGKTLVDLGDRDPRITLIYADVEQSMGAFKERFPHRWYNVGMTEQLMISMAAGMAIEGLRPVCYSLTPFVLERPFEQIKIDIDEQNLPVILIGFSDYPTHGPTHRPLDAEGMAKLFKNITSFFPRNSVETEKAMKDAYLLGGPAFISLKKDGLPIW